MGWNIKASALLTQTADDARDVTATVIDPESGALVTITGVVGPATDSNGAGVRVWVQNWPANNPRVVTLDPDTDVYEELDLG